MDILFPADIGKQTVGVNIKKFQLGTHKIGIYIESVWPTNIYPALVHEQYALAISLR